MTPVTPPLTNASLSVPPPSVPALAGGFNVVNVGQSSLMPTQNQTAPLPTKTEHQVAQMFSQYAGNAKDLGARPKTHLASTREERRKQRQPSTAPISVFSLAKSVKEPQDVAHSRQRRDAASSGAAPEFKLDGMSFEGPDGTTLLTPRGMAPNVHCYVNEVKALQKGLKDLQDNAGKWGDIITKLDFKKNEEVKAYKAAVDLTAEHHNPYFYTQKGVREVKDLNALTTEQFEECDYETFELEKDGKGSISLENDLGIDLVPEGKSLTLEAAKAKEKALKVKYEGRSATKTGVKPEVFDDMRVSLLSSVNWWNETVYSDLMAHLNSNSSDPAYRIAKEMIEEAYQDYNTHTDFDLEVDAVQILGSEGIEQKLRKLPDYVSDSLGRKSFGDFIVSCMAIGSAAGLFIGLLVLSFIACCANKKVTSAPSPSPVASNGAPPKKTPSTQSNIPSKEVPTSELTNTFHLLQKAVNELVDKKRVPAVRFTIEDLNSLSADKAVILQTLIHSLGNLSGEGGADAVIQMVKELAAPSVPEAENNSTSENPLQEPHSQNENGEQDPPQSGGAEGGLPAKPALTKGALDFHPSEANLVNAPIAIEGPIQHENSPDKQPEADVPKKKKHAGLKWFSCCATVDELEPPQARKGSINFGELSVPADTPEVDPKPPQEEGPEAPQEGGREAPQEGELEAPQEGELEASQKGEQ